MKEVTSTAAATLPRPICTRTEHCRVCGARGLTPLLDLGAQAIGNAFHPAGAPPAPKAPLELVLCAGCSMVQLAHSVATDLMYSSYWYRSGVNRTMREHLAALITQAAAVAGLQPGDTVIDIGCNDGTSLAAYPPGIHTIGVDPSNIRPQRCDHFVHDYFSFAAVEAALAGRGAKIVTSIAMFYDLDAPQAFARDIRKCLRADGIWVLELSYLPAMLEAASYDTICHEHVSYYRLATFERVLAGTGLELFDVEFNASNGGSFRLFVAPERMRHPSERLQQARLQEQLGRYDTKTPYDAFVVQVQTARAELLSFLHRCKNQGKSVWGYGASTKGMVTLQYCGVTPALLPAIAERNPDKYGLYTPGTGIRITDEAEMRAAKPDYLVVLPWHFLAEFLEREHAYLEAGGKIVVPLPEFKVYALAPAG